MADIIEGRVSATQPARLDLDDPAKVRTSPYGDVYSQPIGKARASAAEEGSYYVAVNPTPGTGIAGITAANGYDATEAFIHILNSAASTKTIVLDYIKLSVTAVGTNGTDLRFDCHLDTGSRFTSGGSVLTGENCLVGGAATQAQINCGAVVAPAATADVVRIGGCELRSAIKVAGDQYLFDFGGEPTASQDAVNATTGVNITTSLPPVVLRPGKSFLFADNAASQSVAASYEVEIGYWER